MSSLSLRPLKRLRPQRAGEDEGSLLWRELRDWRPLDLVGYIAAWIAGGILTAVALFVLAFLAVKGISYLSLDLVLSRPEPVPISRRQAAFSIRSSARC